MSWLAAADARARLWPWPVAWLYLAVKWSLILLGGWALTRVLLDRVGIWPFY